MLAGREKVIWGRVLWTEKKYDPFGVLTNWATNCVIILVKVLFLTSFCFVRIYGKITTTPILKTSEEDLVFHSYSHHPQTSICFLRVSWISLRTWHFVNQHPTSRKTSHIPNIPNIPNIPHPEHPTSRTSHILNIPHPQHPTSRTFHILNMPLP